MQSTGRVLGLCAPGVLSIRLETAHFTCIIIEVRFAFEGYFICRNEILASSSLRSQNTFAAKYQVQRTRRRSVGMLRTLQNQRAHSRDLSSPDNMKQSPSRLLSCLDPQRISGNRLCLASGFSEGWKLIGAPVDVHGLFNGRLHMSRVACAIGSSSSSAGICQAATSAT
jgi:hypothetical protein